MRPHELALVAPDWEAYTAWIEGNDHAKDVLGEHPVAGEGFVAGAGDCAPHVPQCRLSGGFTAPNEACPVTAFVKAVFVLPVG
jgi:hypothetical protein